MTNKYTHLVDMKTEDGHILHNLEANVSDDGNINFVRNDDGVHAWHCNNINKDDNNVIKITKI